jgi:hypothetical protein
MLLLGGAILLVASVGLSVLAGGTVRSFEVLTWRIGEPPPESLDQLDNVAGLAGLFALGWIVACAGISSPGPGSGVTLAGRILYAAAGLMTIASSLPLAYGTMVMRSMFMILVMSESTPKIEEVELTISHCSWYPILGFDIAALAALFVLLAGVAGLRKAEAQHGQVTSSLRSMIMIGFTALLAVLFALLFIFVSRHGAALEFLMADPSSMAKASELAEHLMGILNKSLCAYLTLLLLGIVQILAAALAPGVTNDEKPEATA